MSDLSEKSDDSDSIGKRQQPLFAFLTALVGISFGLVLTSCFMPFLTSQMKFPWLFYTIFLMNALLASLVQFLMIRTARGRDMFSHSIRITIVLALFAYILFSFDRNQALPLAFFPDFVNCFGVVALVSSAGLDFRFRFLLLSRQDLYQLLQEKSGLTLMEKFSQQPTIVSDAYQQMHKLRRSALTILLIGIALMMIKTYQNQIDWFFSFCFGLLLASTFGLISLSNTYREEHRFFLFGITTPFRFQRIRQDWAYGLLIVCLALAFIIAGKGAPLDGQVITTFISWLTSHFSGFAQAKPGELADLAKIISPPNPVTALMLDDLLPVREIPWIAVLLMFLKILLVFTIGVALIWFLFKPVLDKSFRFSSLLHIVMTKITEFWYETSYRWKKLFCSIYNFINIHNQSLGKSLGPVPNGQDYQNKRINIFFSNKNLQASLINRQSIGIYSDFLDWAIQQGLKVNLSDTPGLIAQKSITVLGNNLSPSIMLLSDSLEKDLFGRTSLDEKGLQIMRECLYTIKKRGPESNQA